MSVIFERFSECAGRTPGKPALILDDKVFTYAELHTLTTSVAAGLFAAGARQDDHIGVILGNTPEFVILMLAAAKLGLVLVPINPSLSAEGIAHAFLTADVQHVVGSKLILEDLKTLWHPASSTRPGIWVTVGGITEHAIAFEDLLSFRTKNDSQPEATFPKDQPFILTMTSGSTGDPKPIIFSQQTKVERATAAQNLYGVTANDITLAATPLYHSLAERLVLLPLMTGGTAVVMPRFTADQWISIVKSHAVTFSIAVSSQLKQILAAMRQHAVSLPSLRCLVSSSALLETSLKSELLSFLHCEFHECYGTSEIAIATNLDPDGARKKVASVGTAIPGVDVKILGADGELCGAGQVGEIICKNPDAF
jgi:long-chain acyl-CoA synthetase